MNEGSAGVGGSAGIFHAAGHEIIHHDLRVFFPGVVDTEFFAEQLHHCGSTSVVDRQAVAAPLGRVIGDRDAAPGIFHLVEFTGDNSDQVGGAWHRLFPIPRFQAFAGIADAHEFAVRNGNPRAGDSEDCFRCQPIIRIVVRREVVTRVFGFALCPNLFRAVWIIFVRQDEVHAFGGFAFVTNGDVEFVSRFGGGR